MANKKHRYAGQRPRNPTIDERIKRMEQSGITMGDLKENYEIGRKEGIQWGYDSAYGSLMLALHREFGWGKVRLARLANATADVQIECLTTPEAFSKIVEETGLTLVQMKDIIDRGGV